MNQGMPSLLYIAMGLQEAEQRAAGWYNGYNDDIYWGSDCNVDFCNKVAADFIAGRLQTFLSDPKCVVDFFGEKIISTWCDPTYQSIWSGPLISLGNAAQTEWLRSLYSGETAFRILALGMNYFNIIIFSFSLVYILWSIFCGKKPLNLFELFCVLFFLGGFLFHLFWEAKCQYVYPYVIFLLPLAANGISTTGRKLEQRLSICLKHGAYYNMSGVYNEKKEQNFHD